MCHGKGWKAAADIRNFVDAWKSRQIDIVSACADDLWNQAHIRECGVAAKTVTIEPDHLLDRFEADADPVLTPSHNG